MFLPKAWLANEFRDTFLELLSRAYQQGQLCLVGQFARLKSNPPAFAAWCAPLAARQWITHAKPVQFQGAQPPANIHSAERVVKYLARYASGTAMSNQRLVSLDDGRVTFSYKDYRDHARRKITSLPAEEFIDRLLSHVLPQGMRHVRHYGFLTPTQRTEKLQTIRALLGAAQDPSEPDQSANRGAQVETVEPGRACPYCGQKTLVRLMQIPRPTVAQIMALPLHQAHRQLLLTLQMEYP
jgi:Putative transposase